MTTLSATLSATSSTTSSVTTSIPFDTLTHQTMVCVRWSNQLTNGRRNKWILGVRCLCLCIYIYTYVCIRYTLLHILYRFYTYFCSPAAGTILAVFIWLHWGFPYSEQLSTVAFSFHNTPENLQHFRKQLIQLLEYADSTVE